MKKSIILLIFIAVNVGVCSAQRFIGIKAAHVQGGYSTNKAMNLEAGFEKFFGVNNGNSFTFSLNYATREATVNKAEKDVKLTDLTFNVGGRKYFNSVDYFLPYVGVDLFCGYSIAQKSNIPETVYLERDNSILYGARANVGCEYLFSIVSVYITITPQYEFKYKEFSANANIGLKYFF
ncbi:MAG: hypothetical protein ACK5KL_19370 [Dysgonomonas sp.]